MRRISAPLVACSFGWVVSACGSDGFSGAGAAEDVDEADRYGGTAVVGHIADIPTLNPLFTRESVGRGIQQFVLFTPVIRLAERTSSLTPQTLDEKYEPAPALARAWEVRELSGDSADLIFHLRDDVYWHDGVKTTAWDLKLSYDLLRTPPIGTGTALSGYGEAVVVDSFTIRIRFQQHADHLEVWQSIVALPRHLLEDVPPGDLHAHAFGNETMLGNGPFRFVERVHGESWTFEANHAYPAALGGRPYLDRLEYRVLSDREAALDRLLTGDVDFLISVMAEQADRIKAAAGTRLVTFPSQAQVVLAWNTRRSPYSDVRVRRALTMGVDRAGLIDRVLHGYGQLANSPVPPMHWAYDAATGADLGYHPERARELLKEVGWTPAAHGQLENASGEPLRLDILAAQDTELVRFVAADLLRLGVAVEVVVLEFGELLQRIASEVRDFDAIVTGVMTDFRMDVRAQFHCEYHGSALHMSGYCDPQADRLMELTQASIDRSQALEAWTELQQRLAFDQPHTFLYFAERLIGVSQRLNDTRPDARSEWQNVTRWWIAPDRRGPVEVTSRVSARSGGH
jgi:peptide/nickel transport system substrate-binding protein